MTEEYKKNLLNLISGKAQDAILGADNSENQISSTEYDYSGILPTGATNFGLYGILDAPENLGNKSVLYGEYQLDSSWYGIVILIDENQTPIEVLTEFDSGTKLRPIQKMIMDDTGNIYAVDCTMPGHLNFANAGGSDAYNDAVLRFIMLNNFTVASPNYEVKLRRAYNITGQVSVTAVTFFCRDMFKDPNSSSYVLVGSRILNNTQPQAINLTINVGSSNEWTLYTKTYSYAMTILQACNVEWSGGTPEILMFVSTFDSAVNDFALMRYISNDNNSFDETNTGVFIPQYIVATTYRSFISYKFFSNNLGYFTALFLVNAANMVQSNMVFKYENGTVTWLYEDTKLVETVTIGGETNYRFTNQLYVVGGINDFKFLKISYTDDTYTSVDVFKSGEIGNEQQYERISESEWWVGYFRFDDTPIATIELPVLEPQVSYYEARKILWFVPIKKTNYNLNYYYLFPAYLPSLSDGKYSVVKNMYVANGYSGSYPTYDLQDTYLNSLVPSQAIATHEEGQETVTDFARNIYNIQIDDNITTSSVEVPYNYLNSEGNQIALYSKTNLPMINNYTMVKNKYEIVDVNFVNSISVINNNDNAGIYNQGAANKINRSVTVGADYTYYLGKILINYTDNTQRVENINVEIDDDTHAHAVTLVYVDKAINNIEFVDESTQFIEGGSVLVKGFAYQTIDGSSLDVGKFYNITQPFHIE